MVAPVSVQEQRAIDALHRLAARWPKTLWLFSASGRLHVMRVAPDGSPQRTYDDQEQDYILDDVDIPNDGGDW